MTIEQATIYTLIYVSQDKLAVAMAGVGLRR